jgi:type IV pilus assembly protein PilA
MRLKAMKKRFRPFWRQKGFTLVELMIVVIIIGILAAVGVPLYLGYVRDAKTASAQATIAVIANAEKIYNQQNGKFIANVDLTIVPNDLNIDVRDSVQNWTLSIPSADDTHFTVTAVGKGTKYGGIEVDLAYDIATGQTWTKKENDNVIP